MALEKHFKWNCGNAVAPAMNCGTAGMLATKQWRRRNACNENVALQEGLQRKSGTAERLAKKQWHYRNACDETLALQECLQ